MAIHTTAQIDPSAKIHESCEIGPFCIIGPNVTLEAGVKIGSHAVIECNTILHENVVIGSTAILGGPPQDLTYKGEPTFLEVGKNTRIGEFATLHRSTKIDTPTRIGENCLLMAYTHVGHDCQVSNNVVMANNAQLAGHVTVDDYVIISAQTGVHQFVRVGTMVMISAYSGVRKDPPPYSIVDGSRPCILKGVNNIGLRRRNIGAEDRLLIKRAYKMLFQSNLNLSQGIDEVEQNLPMDNPYVAEMIRFVKNSKRGIVSRTKATINSEDLDDTEPFKNDSVKTLIPAS